MAQGFGDFATSLKRSRAAREKHGRFFGRIPFDPRLNGIDDHKERRPLTRLTISTITAITSNKWMSAPPK
jgi:hypothetical protein